MKSLRTCNFCKGSEEEGMPVAIELNKRIAGKSVPFTLGSTLQDVQLDEVNLYLMHRRDKRLLNKSLRSMLNKAKRGNRYLNLFIVLD